jgi:hypothetical protein
VRYLILVGECLMSFNKPSARIYLIAGLASVALLVLLLPLRLQAQSDQYFPETGHTVRGEFLDYFNQHGGLRIFGYPITEEFVLNGRTMQYFQRARLDLFPERPAGQRVQLGALGEALGKQTPAKAASGSNPYFQRYYPETGHTVIPLRITGRRMAAGGSCSIFSAEKLSGIRS